MPTVQPRFVVVTKSHIGTSVQFINVVSDTSLEECTEINSFPIGRKSESISPVRVRLAYHGTVITIQPIFTIQIFKTNISRLGIRLYQLSLSVRIYVGIAIYLLLILENTIMQVTVEEAVRTPVLSPTDLAAHTTADIIETDTVGALVCYGILHIRSISIDTQIHFTHLKAIGRFELDTFVLHCTRIDRHTAITGIKRNRHGKQHVLRLLHEIVGRECQCTVEETQVNTQVGLFGGLPFQIGIGIATGQHARIYLSIYDCILTLTHHTCIGKGANTFVTILSPA